MRSTKGCGLLWDGRAPSTGQTVTTLRTFIALELSPEVIAELERCQERLRREVDFSVVWADPKGIHLTMKFLGETNEERIPGIVERLASIAAGSVPFSLSLGHFGVSPSLARPRVLWIGLEGDLATLGFLQKTVTEEMAVHGFGTEDRPFMPHLTLGRIRPQQRRSPPAFVSPSAGGEVRRVALQVRGMSLIRSQLTARGPVYTRLAEFSFRG